jgi:Protein of unknown function (DUF2817)
MSVADHFSATYTEARAKFRSALASAGGAIESSYANPARGPAGEELFTDVGRIGPRDAKKVLLLNSGTHGVEGYSASGCYTGWLARGHHRRDLRPGVAVVFVHAINPHGFAWARRVNEDNVDLNRNFVDHAKPYPVNDGYEALREQVNPATWTPDVVERADNAILAYYNNPPRDFLPKAVHGGQYSNPRGTFYGGKAPTWSNQTFRTILAEHLRAADTLCMIDYHTGSGVYGYAELFVEDRTAKGVRGRDWFDDCVPMDTMVAEHGHNQAEVPGLLMNVPAKSLPDKRVIACLVELRTRRERNLLHALRAENWFFQHGDPDSPAGRAVRAQVREAFYPDDPAWRAMVFMQSNAIIAAALAGLAALG